MARDSYNTRTREIVSEEVKSFNNGFTIKELKESLDKKEIKIGLTTIYRALERLLDDGIVKKYFDENNIAHFKYVMDCNSERHFYLKCDKCNKMYHIDCGCIDDLSLHILKQHKFSIDTRNIILSGLCNSCKNFIKL